MNSARTGRDRFELAAMALLALATLAVAAYQSREWNRGQSQGYSQAKATRIGRCHRGHVRRVRAVQ